MPLCRFFPKVPHWSLNAEKKLQTNPDWKIVYWELANTLAPGQSKLGTKENAARNGQQGHFD